MKWKGWIGGMLLVMMLFGTLGCGKKRGPVTGGMVDGPGMMYTPEDQSPFAGKWQSRDGSIVMEVESSDPVGELPHTGVCGRRAGFRVRYVGVSNRKREADAGAQENPHDGDVQRPDVQSQGKRFPHPVQ